jgi:nucleotide-binding universal stress UspA family protein
VYKTIILPLDGSELAEQAIPHAGTLARALNARIVLARAYNPLQDLSRGAAALQEEGATARELVAETERIVRAEAHDYLAAIRERLQKEGLDVQQEELKGAPVPSLVELVSRTEDPMVVMTTRGRSGLKRLVLGSVAYGLVHALEIPIHLIPSTRS